MSIAIKVSKDHDPKTVRDLADGIWAAQKDNASLSFDVREQMKGLCSALYAEAMRLEKNR